MLYRKKIKAVEAFRYGIEPLPEWALGRITDNGILDGKYLLAFGCYVIKDGDNVSPSSAEWFERNYELMEKE